MMALPVAMGKVARNLAGSLLILAGLILWLTPIVPGGALIVPGVVLLDFPGKRQLFLRLERTRLVSRVMARTRGLARAWRQLYADPRRGNT